METKHICIACNEMNANHAETLCEKCCDHSDIDRDEFMCLDCGKDMTEYLMVKLEYRTDMERDR